MAISTQKPGDGFPDVKPSRTAQATGTLTAERLTPGVLYTATVRAREIDGTYNVTTEDPRQEISGVRLALPVLGGLFGLQIRCNLSPLTRVKIAYGAPTFITQVLPEANVDWLNGRTRSLLWGPVSDIAEGITKNIVSDHAEDLVEGEVEISNLFGIALEFLTTLIRMKAGDRAVVECHLINDMVRVISAQYRHISGLGEDLIYDHGRPTMERSWSMYRHEVLGIGKDKESLVGEDGMNGDEVDREKLEERRVTGLGRMRFKEFLGFAGDFIHSFVSDPPRAIVSLGAGTAKSGAGKNWIHRNSDGSLIIQSVADIRIERTTRIPVPVRIAHHEDPAITKVREYDKLTAAFLKLPSAIQPVDEKDMYQAAYHIRSYSRWLSRYHAFARMLQQDTEYTIPSEAASPTPDWRNLESDRNEANGRTNYTPLPASGDTVDTLYYDAYACITIMRDGSIVTHDGYGSSVVMSNGNVQISAAKHIDLEAAGDIRMVSGGSIYMKARRSIEISATFGGLILHSYAWLKMLCEKGTLWLRSNAVTDKDGDAPAPASLGMPVPEVAGRVQGEKHGFAILSEAAVGRSAYRSEQSMAVVVDGLDDLIVSTNGALDLRGKLRADLRSSSTVRVAGGSQVVIATSAILTNASEVVVGANPSSPDLVLRGGLVWCKNLYADAIQGKQITGPERGPIIPIPDSQPTLQLKSHLNHIDTFLNNTPPATPAGASLAQRILLAEAAALPSEAADLAWTSSAGGPLWGFPSREEYVWNNREKTSAGVPETLTQQYLRLDADMGPPDRWGGPGYADWRLRMTVKGDRIRESGGFGYHEILYRASDTGENLHAPSINAASSFSDVNIEWRPTTDAVMKALKRQEEVQP